MKELIFKADTEEDLYKLAKVFCDGFIQNCVPYEKKLVELNPIGKEIVNKKCGAKKTNLTIGEMYKIIGWLNGKVYITNDNGVKSLLSTYHFANIDYPDKDIYK
jgi:hypothetical protein